MHARQINVKLKNDYLISKIISMQKLLFIFALLLSATPILPQAALAHPGETDTKGGHYCHTNCDEWGLYQNEYHYHNANGTPVFTYDNNSGFYNKAMANRLKGRILLQVEDHGEAWFVRNSDAMRYYMPDGDAAYQMMRYFSLGISDADLAKIPQVADTEAMNKSTSACRYSSLANRLKGEILLQVEQHGEAYYVDPVKCRAIYMKDGAAAYQIMRYLGLGAKNEDIEKVVLGMSDTILEYLFQQEEQKPQETSLPAVDPSRDHIIGPADAEITLIEYSDFECPFCARHKVTMDAIKETYPNDVRVVFRHFPLAFHANANKAAEASECAADQGKFWEMHTEIFDLNQTGSMSVSAFKQAASDIGLDRGQFDSCLDSGIKSARVQEDVDQGAATGIQGTPATFINGELVSGALPLDSFLEMLSQLGAKN